MKLVELVNEFFTPRQKKLMSWSIVTIVFVAALFMIGKFLVACFQFIVGFLY
jgi:hypothetical protein